VNMMRNEWLTGGMFVLPLNNPIQAGDPDIYEGYLQLPVIS
jgi:hypothetical protein